MSTLRSRTLLARVDALPPAARAALQAASILGLKVPRDALCELIGADLPEVLLAHRLLQPAGDGLAFAHALIRDTILASLPAARRRHLHRAAASWYARHLALAGAPEAAAAHLTAARALLSLTADAQGLTTEIRFQRGNVLFDLARFDECLSVHAAVAAEAQRSGSLRLQALAEGGLGDAEYLRGRLLTAHRHFARCVALAEQAGLSGMVPANLAMQAWTAFFGNRLEQGIADARRALALAQARQDAHAEGLTFGALIPVLLANGRREEAESESERSLVAGRRIGAPRQIADALAGLAEARGLAGDRDHAIVLLDEAMSALGASGLPYAGALIQGLIARFARSPAERRHAIAAGEALLADGSISHNHLLFHQHAIDAWLDAEDWMQVEHHADALADYTADEPLPWADFQIRRARALATAGRGSPDIDALTDLIDEGHRVGLLTALPALERMLRRVPPTASGC